MLKIVISLLVVNIFLFATSIFGVVTNVGLAYSDDKKLSLNDNVYVGFDIITKNNSRIVIKQPDKTIIAIGKNSQLKLLKSDEVKLKEGRSYFNIVGQTVAKLNKYKFKIKLKTAILGIRGTNFIVSNNNKHDGVILRKGKIKVISNNKEFEIYKQIHINGVKTLKDEFSQFLKKSNNDFNSFKDDAKYQFEKHTKSFDLKQNSSIVFDNNKIYKTTLNKQMIKEEFKQFDEFIGNKE
jgi:hypothetical protein